MQSESDQMLAEQEIFKLRKRCDEFNSVLRSAISEGKIYKKKVESQDVEIKKLKLQLKERNYRVKKQNQEMEELQRKYQEILSENNYLKTYNIAVEGVAEGFCKEKLKVEKSYKNLKRKSTLLLNQSGITYNLDEETEAEIETEVVPRFDEVKIQHEKDIENFQKEVTKQRKKTETLEAELEKIRNEKTQLLENMELKKSEKEKLLEETKVLKETYNSLKVEYDGVMKYFEPYLKFLREHKELKRTSQVLLDNAKDDAHYLEFLKMADELKEEIKTRDLKIKELEEDISQKTLENMTLNLDIVDKDQKLKDLNEKSKYELQKLQEEVQTLSIKSKDEINIKKIQKKLNNISNSINDKNDNNDLILEDLQIELQETKNQLKKVMEEKEELEKEHQENGSVSHDDEEINKLKNEITGLKQKLKDITAEKEKLHHENRILKEQKGGFSVPPPPPPQPPPPPPPEQKKFKLFNIKKPTQKQTTKPSNPQADALANMMNELQKRILDRANQTNQPSNSDVRLRGRSMSVDTGTQNIQTGSNVLMNLKNNLKKVNPQKTVDEETNSMVKENDENNTEEEADGEVFDRL